MAAVDGVDTHTLGAAKVLVSGENGVSTSPAETNDTNLVGAGNEANLLDEILNQGACDALTVLEQPWTKSCAGLCGCGSLLSKATGLALRLLRFNGLQERDGQRVALVNVGDIGGEPCVGVLVCQQTDIGKLPAEDWWSFVSIGTS